MLSDEDGPQILENTKQSDKLCLFNLTKFDFTNSSFIKLQMRFKKN